MTVKVPLPGDVVTVVTRHRDYYYKRTSDWKETVYENVRVVRPPHNQVRPHEFCIPVPPEEQFSSIEAQEKHDRAPEFDSRAMRYKSKYTPGERGHVAKFDTRVISMRNVVSINGVPVERWQESFEEVQVPGSKGNVYRVTLQDGVGKKCSCKGFQFRQTCRHLREAEIK